MENKKKKIIIISTIVITSFIIIGIVYALVSGKLNLFGKTTTGSVEIETLNLSLKKTNGSEVNVLEPADINILSWTTKNIGTSGILTRHTLEIYWNDETDANANNLLYLYPANMSKEAILADYEKGEESKYLIKTEKVSKTVNGQVRYGIKYQFLGDTLDGTDMTGVSKEKNYNLNNSEVTIENAKTDDNESASDSIAYKILLSPKTSYLYQGKNVSVKVTTEAMQYTEAGSENWKVVDTQEIKPAN